MVLKPHYQSPHPTSDKFINLINNKGIPWSNNNEMKEYRKSQKTVPYVKYTGKQHQDLLQDQPGPQHSKRQQRWILSCQNLLHLIDPYTRLSASTIILNKNSDTIIKAIFRISISVYRSSHKFLTDNGGKFAHNECI